MAGIYSNSRSFLQLTMREERFRIRKHVHTFYAIFIPLILVLFILSSIDREIREIFVNINKILSDRSNIYIPI